MSTPLVGIDLGGTKVEAAIVFPNAPDRAAFRTRLPTESHLGYEHIVSQIKQLTDLVRAELGPQFPVCVGIGTPGTLDPKTQLLRGSNTQCLNRRPLKADLESAIGVEFAMANDANCFALAEATLGAARGYETVFGAILGTGCGGGLVVHQKVLNGCHGIAGEWGQIVLEPEGELSGYGTRGIIETMLPGPALEKFYAKRSGVHRPLREVVERARAGNDPDAIATIDRLKTAFARSITVIINAFDPHAIVIGGGVGNIDELYAPDVREMISEQIFAPSFEAPILKPQLGDSAGVFGAAMLTAE